MTPTDFTPAEWALAGHLYEWHGQDENLTDGLAALTARHDEDHCRHPEFVHTHEEGEA